jgi:hypothetical protein
VFCGYPRPANVTAQTPPQEILKERMQPVFFAAPVAGDGNENVAANEVG